jgi:hypothetical protein
MPVQRQSKSECAVHQVSPDYFGTRIKDSNGFVWDAEDSKIASTFKVPADVICFDSTGTYLVSWQGPVIARWVRDVFTLGVLQRTQSCLVNISWTSRYVKLIW